MSNDRTAVEYGINLLEEDTDHLIARTNESLTDANLTAGDRSLE